MDNADLEKLKEALSQRDIKMPSDDTACDTNLGVVDLSKISIPTNWPNVTINSTSSWGSYNIPTLGNYHITTGGTTLNTGGAGNTWTSFSNGTGSNSGKVELNGDDADILIKGRSLKEFMEKMENRLAILVPEPNKLEHFEALKKAYEHYKTLESLCELPKPENNQ
jgi:hypothetical protein